MRRKGRSDADIEKFHIFVVLINNIMQSKEIITAPIADAIIPSGVVDKPSACGAFICVKEK